MYLSAFDTWEFLTCHSFSSLEMSETSPAKLDFQLVRRTLRASATHLDKCTLKYYHGWMTHLASVLSTDESYIELGPRGFKPNPLKENYDQPTRKSPPSNEFHRFLQVFAQTHSALFKVEWTWREAIQIWKKTVQ